MAVYAAHLTRTLQGTPSVFQVNAQEALGSTVKPALRKVLEYLNDVYPGKYSLALRWYDELFLLIDGCLQYHYLKHYAASFAESFYGLIRAPLASTSEFSSGQRLGPKAEQASLLMLLLLPYCRDKLQKAVERWNEDEGGGKNKTAQARQLFTRIYPLIHFTYETSRLVHLARYVAGSARSPALELAVLGLTLKDAPAAREQDGSWSDLRDSLVKGDFSAALSAAWFPALGALLLRGAEYAAFLVQFARWWAERGAGAGRGAGGGGLPAPPHPPQKSGRISRCVNKCPLCAQPWRSPAALPVSGLIFCYICISRELRANKRCPVTALPATEDQLVRIYLH